MSRVKPAIKYTSRDFDSIKQDLVQYARRYYPEVYRDFNEASFGSLMLDTVSYVGDILSFYVDYQVNESFLDTAAEFSNVVRLSKQLGYKFRGVPSATGISAFYVVVPANEVGLGPRDSFIPILKRGSTLTADDGTGYILEEDVFFNDPNSLVVVASVDDATGQPQSYAIKSHGRIVSGEIARERIPVGNFTKFRKVPLSSTNITDIISVVDEEGHEYFEVDYLSQNVIHRAVTNRGVNNSTVAAIMKPHVVPRRFTVERIDGRYFLQFGYGSDSELKTNSVAEPSSITLKMHARDFVDDTTFDPARLLDTDKFGVAPANTTLTVTYRKNTKRNSNARIGAITTMGNTIISFDDDTKVPVGTRNNIRRSVEAYNEEQIVGSSARPTTEELKRRAFDTFATQNRAVTLQDFEAVAYSMPPKFGSIKRIRVVQDPDSFKRNLNLYVLAEDSNGLLTEANNTLKENLKMWLNNYKMIHDTVDILDGKIVNYGIEYHAIANPEFNKFDVLQEAQNLLAEHFSQPLYMGEPLYITDVYNLLNKNVSGIIDVKSVKITQKSSGPYSRTTYDFNAQTTADGRVLLVPDNTCLELKFPASDIKGTIE
tara:strand:+ start:1130 stop:2926 length:1797 start_codon:yes stop_codon:yes gene_type:complete